MLYLSSLRAVTLVVAAVEPLEIKYKNALQTSLCGAFFVFYLVVCPIFTTFAPAIQGVLPIGG